VRIQTAEQMGVCSWSLQATGPQDLAQKVNALGLKSVQLGLTPHRDDPGTWEGVDVPGRSLEQVIIARLPFRVPTEPVLEARAQAIEQRGGDPFMEYTVPQAVIRFKQGFGRLIRHRSDRGVVLILDTRVVKKGYGRMFLRSLPPARVIRGHSDEVFTEIGQFFSESYS